MRAQPCPLHEEGRGGCTSSTADQWAGRPYDGDPRGGLALCDFPGEAKVRCRIVRFAYSVESVIVDLQARGAKGIGPQDYRTGTRTKQE